MLQFAHSIAGGQGNLIATSLQSPNFVTEVSGWQIAKDGSAEFNNVTIRGGDVIGGTTLIYNGTPAHDNLSFSISGTAGTDSFGNAYLAGVWAYNSTGGGVAIITVSGNAGLIIPPGGTTHANEPPQASGFAGNTGLANEYVGLQLLSGIQTTNAGNAAIDLFSETNDGTGGARGALIITGTQIMGWNGSGVTIDVGSLALPPIAAPGANSSNSAQLYGNTTGTPSGVTDNGAAGALPLVQSDTSVGTNANVTGAHSLSAVYTIPANDLNNGAHYYIEMPFNATMESQNLTLGMSIDGATAFTCNTVISGAIVGAGGSISGTIRVHLKSIVGGTSGTVNAWTDGDVNTTSTPATFTNSGALNGNVDTGITLNTTVSHTIRINSLWAAAAAGQTVSGYGSECYRVGP